MNPNRSTRRICLALALSLALPAFAADPGADLKDSANEASHDTRKAIRQHKPGGEDLGDKAADAKDTAASKKAQARKKLRGRKKAHRKVHEKQP